MQTFENIDEHIAGFPESTQKMLNQLRELIKERAPEATETISYGIPTFVLNGNLVHFAGYAGHIGFYPGSAAIVEFKDLLTHYKTSKGTVQFRLTEPLPVDLIARIVDFRVEANRKKSKKGKKPV
jgi:uncharacterized protein YdhG (YjbR/CyaY superfamily)